MIATLWTVSDTGLTAGVVVLLALSGFFAMAETSLVRMNRSRARSLQDANTRGASALVALVESPDSFLNPLLLLILVCQLVSATMVGVLAAHLFGGAGVFVATVLEVIVIFVIFEAIPKNFAVRHPDRAALLAAPTVHGILKFPPVRWISGVLLTVAHSVINLYGTSEDVGKITDDEIIAMATVAAEEDSIEETERDLIESVIEFGDTVVREVMVPRLDIVDVDATATVLDALAIAIETGRSRLPVLGEGIDDVVGITNLRHLAKLLAEGKGHELVGEHMGKVSFVPETKKVASLLAQIRNSQVHLFVVVDEYGGTAGLVTLEDILEELVGEITDESDEMVVVEEETQETDEKKSRGPWELSGRLNIDDVNDEFDISLPKDGWDTIGGLILDLAGGVPSEGDLFELEHYRITVLRMDNRRIEEVLIERRETL